MAINNCVLVSPNGPLDKTMIQVEFYKGSFVIVGIHLDNYKGQSTVYCPLEKVMQMIYWPVTVLSTILGMQGFISREGAFSKTRLKMLRQEALAHWIERQL